MEGTEQNLKNIVTTMSTTKVLIIGDVMLDEYQWCEVRRISPEAPVPIATVIEETSFLGGAGNVAHNVHSLGAKVSFVTVVGDDTEGVCIKNLLTEKKIDTSGVVTEVGRQSTLKRRIVSGTQQLLRVDKEIIKDISQDTKNTLFNILPQKILENDVVVISDYCKGLLSDDVVSFVMSESNKAKKRIFVDSKNRHLLKYSGVYLLKPNKEEAEILAGEKFTDTYSNLESIGERLSEICNSNLVITLGKDGMAVFEEGRFYRESTKTRQVFDVSGAGDTVLSVLATAIAAGADLVGAVHLSNIAAGHVVGCLGIAVCTPDVLQEALK